MVCFDSKNVEVSVSGVIPIIENSFFSFELVSSSFQPSKMFWMKSKEREKYRILNGFRFGNGLNEK